MEKDDDPIFTDEIDSSKRPTRKKKVPQKFKDSSYTMARDARDVYTVKELTSKYG